MASNPATSLPPGFRFHPTDEELILHYLRNRSASLPCPVSIIAEVDIYKFDPWDLPAKSMFGEREWYFFSPRDRKYPNGIRPNRAAASGYWKATGTDKAIVTSNGNENIGVKKALVFYKGRPPKGVKTDWIMHEYRLAQSQKSNSYKPLKLRDASMRLDDWVLCRIYKKSGHQSPSGDAEPEEYSSVDEAFHMPNTSSSTPPGNNTFLKLPKSCSLTELLDAVDCSAISRLLENPSDMFGLENCSFGYPLADQALSAYGGGNNNVNGSESVYQVHKTSQTEPPQVMATDNALKRLRSGDGCYVGGGGGVGSSSSNDLFLNPAKRPANNRIMSNITNNYDATQFNFISLPLLNQQLVLNSRLGKQ